MKRIYASILTLLLLVITAADAQAGLKKLGNAGFTFLKVTQSPRIAGMGDAFTASAMDIHAIYWNPAGLAYLQRPSFALGYNNWMVDSKFYSGAIAARFGNHAIGLSIVSFTPDAFEETTIFQPNGTGVFIKDSDIAIGIAYAVRFTDRLSFGAHARFIQEKLYTDTNRGIDISVGTLFYTGFRSLRLAMALKNFGQDNVIIDDVAFRPLIYNIGVAMEVYGDLGDPVSLTVSAENAFYVDYEGRIHTGAELWLYNVLALRGGYKFNNDTESYSLGFGLKYSLGERPFTVDFSYSDMGDHFDATYRVSIGGAF